MASQRWALTPQEEAVYIALKRLADDTGRVTSRQLHYVGFAKTVTAIYDATVAFPESFQSRKLEILRYKQWIKMERFNGDSYTLLP